MQFKDKLIELRKEHNLSQQGLGDELYVSRKTISSWENERTYPDIKSLIKISKLFNISLDYLLIDDCDLVQEYTNQSKVRWKNHKINTTAYFINILIIIIFHIGIVPPVILTIPYITLFLLFNIIVWMITFNNRNVFKKNKVIFWISLIIIFLIEFPIRLSKYPDIINDLNDLFSNESVLGGFIGVVLKTIIISFGIVIIFFGCNKLKK